ncbi:hypothetical protein BH24DEI2_BH24DEI2_27530 [soil metagenome]
MRARTTIRLDERLLKDVKRHALERNKTLTAVVEEALRDKLCYEIESFREPFALVTHDGGGTQPGVDLSDSSLLQDIMDGLVDPS